MMGRQRALLMVNTQGPKVMELPHLKEKEKALEGLAWAIK